MSSLRTREMSQKYLDYRVRGGLDNGCRLCDAAALKTYKFWKITNNNFPFDRIAEVHHMLLPLRHAREKDLTEEERNELLEIKESTDLQKYNVIIEAMHKRKSIPGHFHLHLVITKDFEKK